MYIFDGTLHSVGLEHKNWIYHSIRVFEGEFTNPDDLNKIVDTCLGLWATAYYTHRVIVGAGIIAPQPEHHKSSFHHSASYSAHVYETLRPSNASASFKCALNALSAASFLKSETGSTSEVKLCRSGRMCAKIHPDLSPNAEPTASRQLPPLEVKMARVEDSASMHTSAERPTSDHHTVLRRSGVQWKPLPTVPAQGSGSPAMATGIKSEVLRLHSVSQLLQEPTSTAPLTMLLPTHTPSSSANRQSLDERFRATSSLAGASSVVWSPDGEPSINARSITRTRRWTPTLSTQSDLTISNVGSMSILSKRWANKVSTGLTNKVALPMDDPDISGRQSQRESSRTTFRDSTSRYKVGPKARLQAVVKQITKEVIATEVSLKSSNTIYDIVSLQKKEVFPTNHFGELVELLEACIDDGKIVPILRSQRNTELVNMNLNPANSVVVGGKRPPRGSMFLLHTGKSTMEQTRRRLTRMNSAGMWL